MNLKEKRILFTECLNKLLTYMIQDGVHPAMGKDGLPHMKNSLHYDGLAKDIDLYDKDMKYLNLTIDHKKYGEYWESLHELCSWGGRFNDGNHYSIKDGGRK